MAHLNSHYLKLKAGYLFPEIGRRVKAFAEAHPDAAARLIRCGIGDVTEPLPAAAREAMHSAVDDLGQRETFHGYGPEGGYEFLRHASAESDYRSRGIEVSDDEVFVSDGSKCDCANILDIFGNDNRIAVMDPVYPVYVDTNVMAGHTGAAEQSGDLRRPSLFALHSREWLYAGSSWRAGRPCLLMLTEQPDWCSCHPRTLD